VNEPAHGIGTDEPQQPEDKKDDGESPQHDDSPSNLTSSAGSLDAHAVVYLPMTFSTWLIFF
jgi:hypothetical protein